MKKRYSDRYQKMLDEFLMYYPVREDDVLEWYASGMHELTILMKNGERRVFNQTAKTVRYIPKIDDLYDSVIPSENAYKNVFAFNLRCKIAEAGMTQQEFAQRTGLKVGAINSYVTGKSLPGVYNLRRIARVLRCSVEELVELF